MYWSYRLVTSVVSRQNKIFSRHNFDFFFRKKKILRHRLRQIHLPERQFATENDLFISIVVMENLFILNRFRLTLVILLLIQSNNFQY